LPSGKALILVAGLLPFALPWEKPKPPSDDWLLVLEEPAVPDPPPPGSIMDLEGPRTLPENWRTNEKKLSGKSLNTAGMSGLHMSGSGQFSKNQLYRMREVLKDKHPVIVDLRQESHGFIDQAAIAWGPPPGPANAISASELETREARWLEALLAAHYVTATRHAPGSFYDMGSWEEIDLKFDVRTVAAESTLIDKAGWRYRRIPVIDFQAPSDESVDRFVAFVREMDPGTWLHFHCDTGLGRTTLFMTMLDMMQNFFRANRDEIIARERQLNGVNLLKIPDADSPAAEGMLARSKFLKRFFSYCFQNGPAFRRSWSSWKKAQLRGESD